MLLAVTTPTAVGGIAWAKHNSNRANKAEAKRQADKAGREKTLRDIAAMPEAEITVVLVKKLMFANIGEALKVVA